MILISQLTPSLSIHHQTPSHKIKLKRQIQLCRRQLQAHNYGWMVRCGNGIKGGHKILWGF